MAIHYCGGYCDYQDVCKDPQVRAVGKVLTTFEQNLAYDSYFYAVYWNDRKNGLDLHQYASTAFGTHHSRVEVDATDEVWEDAYAWMADQWEPIVRAELSTVGIGRRVRSLTTRGKACGVTGEVIDLFESTARWNRGALTAVVKVDTPRPEHGRRGTVYVAANRLQVLNPVDPVEVRFIAWERARRVSPEELMRKLGRF